MARPARAADLSRPARPIADPLADGHVFPLETVARISFVAGQPEITRDNLAQVVAVTAQIGGGKDLGSTIAAVQQALHRPGLLPAVSITRSAAPISSSRWRSTA